jgi:hypothetical protein
MKISPEFTRVPGMAPKAAAQEAMPEQVGWVEIRHSLRRYERADDERRRCRRELELRPVMRS